MSTALPHDDEWDVIPTEGRAGAKARRLESPGSLRMVQSGGWNGFMGIRMGRETRNF